MAANNNPGNRSTVVVHGATRTGPRHCGKGRDFLGQGLDLPSDGELVLRYDDQGIVIPRKIINKFVCRYGEAVVLASIFTSPSRPTRSSSSTSGRRIAVRSSSSGKRTAAASSSWSTNSRSVENDRAIPCAFGCYEPARLLSRIISAAAESDRGAQLAASSSSCHRLDGHGDGIPSIVGSDTEKLIGMMEAYRSNERPRPVMHAVSLSFSSDEIGGSRAIWRHRARKRCRNETLDPSRIGAAAVAAGLALAPRMARGQAKPRVVVIGGGVGGSTVSKYLAVCSKTLDVTLIEPNAHYTTCFFSNLYLAGPVVRIAHPRL